VILSKLGGARRMAVLTLVALVIAVGAGTAYLHYSHPRDEDSFLASMQDSWNGELRRFVSHSPEQVVSEGDRACDWLTRQRWVRPDLSGDTSGDVTGVALLARYAQDTRGDERLAFSQYRERMVRYIGHLAWQHLCGVAFELRHTHHPFIPRDSSNT
jgi:hypothetical protein